jgi:D-glycero-D-manno-heptose 1,7-bisphosphate phosphatase
LKIILVSKQRGIAPGLYTAEDIDAIHAALRNALESHGAHLDGIYYCPHDKNQCDCRKPLPGLFQQAAIRFPDIEAQSSVMIGIR